MNDLAGLYGQQGRYDQAEPLFVKTLEVRRRALGEEHPDTLLSMRNLAELLRAEKKQDQARPYVRQLLALRKKTAERTGADAIDLNEYAWELLTCEPADLRDPVAALPVAQKAVRKSGGKKPAILDTLALAYSLNGHVAKAIETEEKALSLLPPGNSPLRKALEESLAGYRTAASQPATTQPADESGE
jgi:tetratricopeptide (TPR) repeat protein